MADSTGRCAAYHVVYVQDMYVVPATRPLLCCQYLVVSKVYGKDTHPSQNMWITVAIFLLLCLSLYVAVDCVCSSLNSQYCCLFKGNTNSPCQGKSRK